MKVKRSIPIRLSKSLLLSLLWLIPAHSAHAQYLSMQGENVTLSGQNKPLPEILKLFAWQGVEVKVDPEIDFRVEQDFVDEPVEEVLRSLLRDYGHITRWQMVSGPVGDIPRLAGIDVYRKGYANAVRPLIVNAGKIDVVYDPNGTKYARDELLIGVKEGTTLEDFKNIVAAVGGVVVSSVSSRGVYQVKLPPGSNVPAIVARLNNHPKVAAVEPNYVIEEPGPSLVGEAVPSFGAGDSGPASSVGSLKAAVGASTVAVLDTGLSSSVDMGDLVKGVHDAINPSSDVVGDASGHGTQMAMIASGLVQPTGLEAVAGDSGTPVLAIKSFDEEGMTTNFGLMESIQYAIENDARILSLSWGSEVNSEFLQDAIVSAQERDLIVVAAVGNEASGVTSYPAAYDGVIGVGALNADGQLWENSNYGDFVDLVAPGHAAFPIGHEGPPGSYIGTSISTAYVAGHISQLITANPDATQEEITRKLYSGVVDGGEVGDDTRYGRGVLQP